MANEIERLTEEERGWFEGASRIDPGPAACAKALRIIDQLTAALEATTDEALKGRVEYWREACQAVESRAEALQARTVELETCASEATRLLRSDESLKMTKALQALRGAVDVECPGCGYKGKLWEHRCPARAAESALRDLRGRVERAMSQLTLAFGAYIPSWPQGAVETLEALRGR